MHQKLVKLHKNGNDCFYLVNDYNVRDGVVTFTINRALYIYKFSISAMLFLNTNLYTDCTKLIPIHIPDT